MMLKEIYLPNTVVFFFNMNQAACKLTKQMSMDAGISKPCPFILGSHTNGSRSVKPYRHYLILSN